MLTFGVIGDFGVKSKKSAKVASLVKSWKPKVILTTGDNIYSFPSMEHYENIVGKMYKEFLLEVHGHGNSENIDREEEPELLLHNPSTGKCIPTNIKFLPCIGNHDYLLNNYCNYFNLPTYYSAEFIHHPKLVKLISLNNYYDPDGSFETFSRNGVKSYATHIQQKWLINELEQSSDYRWIIVYYHYPQCCSNQEDEENDQDRRFPFYKYPNVALCLSGHHHIYERLNVTGITHLVIGTSGHSIRKMASDRVPQSIFCDDSGFGALKLEINYNEIKGSYYVLSNNYNLDENMGEKNSKNEYCDGPGGVLKDAFTILHKHIQHDTEIE